MEPKEIEEKTHVVNNNQPEPEPEPESKQNISNISNATNSMINTVTVPSTGTLDDFINTPLMIQEKRKLRLDLLSLPPEKLGEIMYVLQTSQPQNIEQKGDELEIDLKKLNTKTLRHLQRYVESVFIKVRYNSMTSPQPTFITPVPQTMLHNNHNNNNNNYINPWPKHNKLLINDLIQQQQQNHLHLPNSRNLRKKRSAFTTTQKEDMVKFWQNLNWQVTDDKDLGVHAAEIGVTLTQLKVFRQNNRKKILRNK